MSWSSGVRRLMDSQQRFLKSAHPVYLRLRNFPDVQQTEWAQMGFSASGALGGTTDIEIVPRPSVMMISYHNIGQSMGKLRFGARSFLISANWVTAQKTALGLTNETLVFRGPLTVGLYLDGLLFSIEDLFHEELQGETTAWGVVCNANELM